MKTKQIFSMRQSSRAIYEKTLENKGASFRMRKQGSKFPHGLKQFFSPYIKQRDLFLLFIPSIIFYAVFRYAPMYGTLIAFKDFKLSLGFSGSEWVGFENFLKLFNTASFWEVFRNSIEISLLRIIFGFPSAIILAILLNEITNTRYKKIVQTVSYLPHFLSWVVLGGIFMQFLSPSGGLVNQILGIFGVKPIYFMGDPKWFRFTLIATGIWAEVGWGSIIYLASLSAIDTQLYEAAAVDGASRFRQIVHITLPALSPVITISLILTTGNIINAGFDQVFNMYNEAVYKVADIIDTYVYRKGLADANYSFGSAVGLFQNVISISMIFVTNAITKRFNEYGIW